MRLPVPYYDHNGITLYCGDCRDILPHLPKVDLVLTDPPYNINKAIWDNIDNYEEWITDIFCTLQNNLKGNGTLWFYHISFIAMAKIHILIERKTSLRHKQMITLYKGLQSITGRTGEDLRSFPRATEYLQFYTFDDPTGAQQLSDKYAKINPMAKYLREEFDRAKCKNTDLAKLFPSKTGGLTGCVSNWLLGYNIPTEEQYNAMRKFLNCEYLRKEYEYLRKEYEYLRYHFTVPRNTTDVWDINFYGNNQNGHPTQKPLAAVLPVIKYASYEADTILDPFVGSGTTLVAAKQLRRKAIGIEISEKYCAITIKRLSQNYLDFSR